MASNNVCIYGIPCDACRVIKFDPDSKFMTHIGPDFDDDDEKWYRGAMTDSSVIYGLPLDEDHGVLKIDIGYYSAIVIDISLRATL